jgi:hypothetical protein
MKEELQLITGCVNVIPAVFIGGKYIGGNE